MAKEQKLTEEEKQIIEYLEGSLYRAERIRDILIEKLPTEKNRELLSKVYSLIGYIEGGLMFYESKKGRDKITTE